MDAAKIGNEEVRDECFDVDFQVVTIDLNQKQLSSFMQRPQTNPIFSVTLGLVERYDIPFRIIVAEPSRFFRNDDCVVTE